MRCRRSLERPELQTPPSNEITVCQWICKTNVTWSQICPHDSVDSVEQDRLKDTASACECTFVTSCISLVQEHWFIETFSKPYLLLRGHHTSNLCAKPKSILPYCSLAANPHKCVAKEWLENWNSETTIQDLQDPSRQVGPGLNLWGCDWKLRWKTNSKAC